MYFQVSIDREEKYNMQWCVIIAETSLQAATVYRDSLGAWRYYAPDDAKIAVQKAEPTDKGLIGCAKGSEIEYFDYKSLGQHKEI